jgi:hypothetical protein
MAKPPEKPPITTETGRNPHGEHETAGTRLEQSNLGKNQPKRWIKTASKADLTRSATPHHRRRKSLAIKKNGSSSTTTRRSNLEKGGTATEKSKN